MNKIIIDFINSRYKVEGFKNIKYGYTNYKKLIKLLDFISKDNSNNNLTKKFSLDLIKHINMYLI